MSQEQRTTLDTLGIDTTEATQAPERPIIIQAPRASFLQTLRNQFLVGAFFHSLSFFFNFWSFIPFVFAAVLALIGWKVMPPQAVRDKAAQIADLAGNLPTGIPRLGKSPEQIAADAARKEAERKRKEESEIRALKARADLIGFDCDPTWSVEDYRVKVPAAEHKKREEARRNAQLEEEERAKRPWLERADKIGFDVDPNWDLKTLKQQVEDAERELKMDADYQAALRQHERDMEAYRERLRHGPNARCPAPRCGWTFHTNRTSGQFGCSRCNGFYNIRSARAHWTLPPPPKEPMPPGKSPGIWGRIKRLVR